MKFALAVSLFLCFGSAVGAEKFTYKGVGVGDMESSISEKLPFYKKSKFSQYFYRYELGDCIKIGGTSEADSQKCLDANSFGGAVVRNGELYVKDGSISTITLNFDATWSNALIDAISAKYGKEKSKDEVQLQNGYGAKFPGVLMKWESAGSILTLTSIGNKDITVKIVSAEDRQKQLDKEKADKEKSAKDF